jgi:hypothetical protein
MIGPTGAEAIATALARTTTLKALKLNGNRIGDIGGAAIGDSLRTNTSLTSLYLQENAVGDVGAVAIATALAGSKCLSLINLNMNVVGDVGVAALGDALETNASLCALSLRGNRVTAVGIEFLNFQRLQQFSVDTHMLVWPPPSISQTGLGAVYTFLESAAEKRILLTRSRVMFVGGGGVGKTTLKTALLLRGHGANNVRPTSRFGSRCGSYIYIVRLCVHCFFPPEPVFYSHTCHNYPCLPISLDCWPEGGESTEAIDG